jgi:3D (Asp-Asp-Asp) domain-containing protein
LNKCEDYNKKHTLWDVFCLNIGYRGWKERRKSLKSRIIPIAAALTITMFLSCATLDSIKAYYPKYAQPSVQPEVITSTEVSKPTEVTYSVVKEIRGYGTGYFGPKQKDYPKKEEYLKAVQMNGKGEKTKSGTTPHFGTIAADTRVYPIGTTIYIPEINFWGTVEDVGPRVKGEKHIDIFCGHGKKGEKIAKLWGAGTPITLRILKIKKVIGA